MELLELYLEEIKRHLAVKNRDDIVKEIRSILMDTIEERSYEDENLSELDSVKAVIQEFGSPRVVARQYGGKNYLISPEMMPTYTQILKIVLIMVVVFNLLGLLITAINPSSINVNMLEIVLEVIGGLFSSLFTAFGIVTLVFAIIERTTKDQMTIDIEQEWKPDDLLTNKHPQPISISGLAFEITLAFIFITLINFFIDRIGIYHLGESGWVSFPILNENFIRYIPWITGYTVMNIALNLYLIRTGYWNRTAVIGKILVNTFTIAVLVAVITGPNIITITLEAWQSLGLETIYSLESINSSINTGTKVVLGLANFGLTVDAVKHFYTYFIKNNFSTTHLPAD